MTQARTGPDLDHGHLRTVPRPVLGTRCPKASSHIRLLPISHQLQKNSVSPSVISYRRILSAQRFDVIQDHWPDGPFICFWLFWPCRVVQCVGEFKPVNSSTFHLNVQMKLPRTPFLLSFFAWISSTEKRDKGWYDFSIKSTYIIPNVCVDF